jgi:crotonobetainyl-CoA:carnitine CoA-transferase CaiB-like acyl-CoA transferase
MSLPLAGVRVLDFTRVVSGPYCALMLGDLGAEVIKAEPLEGDDTRRIVTYEGRRPEDHDYFNSLNRNKKSITLNLKHPEARAIALGVARHCDVLLENFTPGVTSRLGIDYAAVSAVKPDIIYCSITGFGQTGPYRDRRGLDSAIQAMSGFMSLIGDPDGPPYSSGLPIADTCAGMFAAMAIVSSLYERKTTGKGRYIDISMLDSMVAVMISRTAEYLSTGKPTTRMGNENPMRVPTNAYRCADGRYLYIMNQDDAMWKRLCKALQLEHVMDDPRYATNRERVKRRAEVNAIIQERLLERPALEWDRILGEAGVACGPVNDLAQTFADPQVQARQMLIEVEHPVSGRIKVVAPPYKLSDQPAWPIAAPPTLGQHNEEIICGMLGYARQDLERLKAEGAI